MSEQQDETATANRNEPDTSEPKLERQDKLQAAYEANESAGVPPYAGVQIGTYGELLWIMRRRGWVGSPDAGWTERANFSGADLTKIILVGIDLSRANLSGTNLAEANLHSAHLVGTNLSGANLRGADLRGTDVRFSRMDEATVLRWVGLDNSTLLGDIVWNGVPLTQIDWNQVHRLGDESALLLTKSRPQRIAAYHNAARAYRNLSIALRTQGLLIPASKYRLREQVLERKAKFLSFNLVGWAFSWLLNLVAGYGERPVRSFIAYLLVLFGFASVYFALGSGALGVVGLGVQDQVSTPLAAIVFSVTSFHGRGFFPGGDFRLDDPIIVLAALEAIMGLFIEITFIATFTQRFFAR